MYAVKLGLEGRDSCSDEPVCCLQGNSWLVHNSDLEQFGSRNSSLFLSQAANCGCPTTIQSSALKGMYVMLSNTRSYGLQTLNA